MVPWMKMHYIPIYIYTYRFMYSYISYRNSIPFSGFSLNRNRQPSNRVGLIPKPQSVHEGYFPVVPGVGTETVDFHVLETAELLQLSHNVPCMEYLPTCTTQNCRPNVGKYVLHGASGFKPMKCATNWDFDFPTTGCDMFRTRTSFSGWVEYMKTNDFHVLKLTRIC